MIKDGRHTVPDAVKNRGIGARFCSVYGQMTVYLPPGSVEHLIEIRRIVTLDRKPSCKT